jgi:hypothetical protein
MSVIGSDGLSLLVGDGAESESFNPLLGMSVSQLALTQRSNDSAVVGTDAWTVVVGTSNRQLALSVEALATDDASAVRVRSLALTGATVKKCTVKLESSGALTIA